MKWGERAQTWNPGAYSFPPTLGLCLTVKWDSGELSSDKELQKVLWSGAAQNATQAPPAMVTDASRGPRSGPSPSLPCWTLLGT
jgi:hypothetical protein